MPQLPSSRGGAPRAVIVLALAALVLVLAPLSATAWADPDPQEGIGLNVQDLLRNDGRFPPATIRADLAAMAADGLRSGRSEARWSDVEPAAPSVAGARRYDWTATDETAAYLAGAGIRWLPVLHGAPPWASIDPSSTIAAPTAGHDADFAAFAGAFAHRYGAGGTFWAAHPELPALAVREVEIFNEENTAQHWGGPPDPAAYGALFAEARAAVKAVAPQMAVIVGGIVWNDDADYLRGVLAALGPEPLDGVAIHPYAPTAFSILPNVQRMRGVLDAAGRPDVPLRLNELGWPAAYDRPAAQHAIDGPVDDRSRAATMALVVDGLAASTCDVGDIDVYSAIESETDTSHVETLMGIYRRDGSPTLTSRALWDAVARFRSGAATTRLPVAACGSRGAPRTRVLPLKLDAQPTPDGCHLATVTYQGLPLEEAQVRVLSPYRGTRATDALGQASICPPAAGGNRGLHLMAEVPGLASSNHELCDLPGNACRPLGPAAACVLEHAAIVAPRPVKPAQRTVLRLRTAGCSPQLGDAVAVSGAATISGGTAHRLGIAASARRRLPFAAGRAVLGDPGGALTVGLRITRRGRRALARGRRITVQLQVTARETGTRGAVLLRVPVRYAVKRRATRCAAARRAVRPASRRGGTARCRGRARAR